ncbi:uncharacterized protein C8Q71DRAFT_803309 [Rhodofomes roseus]|uniref:F-box domain-containing protein n=1 Tax=Rhodofomes roseus TaxID=34475 RepID=A0ABQ8KSF9_9APHY|nr:uncharacterized protein C8Q71DRAFT_803309 [Rhodofomes roseus]KAH9841515.1 hypothetical protein C8Q71DRAFT_803309 [Rhodofomes roseus]
MLAHHMHLYVLNRGLWFPPAAITYSSDSNSNLPQEVLEYVIDFLWDDPISLARCCLTCRAWIQVAVYHLRRYNNTSVLTIRNRKSLTAHSRASKLMKTKRPSTLEIDENPRKSYVHTFPMLMPGCNLSKESTTLTIRRLDLAIRRPHNQFFRYLSYYTHITALDLRLCRFESTPQLRRMINALPNLTDLELTGITLRDGLVTTLVPHSITLNRKLEKITLSHPPGQGTLQHPVWDGADRAAAQTLLAVCAAYSTVLWLSVDANYFRSLTDLKHFIYSFPHLSHLRLRSHTRSRWSLSSDDVGVRTASTSPHFFSLFELSTVSTACAVQLMSLVSTTPTCSQLEELIIRHEDTSGPVAELLSDVQHTLHVSGAALKKFTWVWPCNSDSQLVPRLTSNRSLRQVEVTLTNVPPSLRIIESALVNLISNLTSATGLSIRIHLQHPESLQDVYDISRLRTDGTDPIPAFHTIICSALFDEFTGEHASIAVDFLERNHPFQTQVATMSIIRSHIVALFAPWLDKKVLGLLLDPDPDSDIRFTSWAVNSVVWSIVPMLWMRKACEDALPTRNTGREEKRRYPLNVRYYAIALLMQRRPVIL